MCFSYMSMGVSVCLIVKFWSIWKQVKNMCTSKLFYQNSFYKIFSKSWLLKIPLFQLGFHIPSSPPLFSLSHIEVVLLGIGNTVSQARDDSLFAVVVHSQIENIYLTMSIPFHTLSIIMLCVWFFFSYFKLWFLYKARKN